MLLRLARRAIFTLMIFNCITGSVRPWAGAKAVPILAKIALNSKEPDATRLAVIHTLGGLGAEAFPTLTTVLSIPKTSSPIRAAAAEALGQMGSEAAADARVIRALTRAISDDATDVRRAASQALARLVPTPRAPGERLDE